MSLRFVDLLKEMIRRGTSSCSSE